MRSHLAAAACALVCLLVAACGSAGPGRPGLTVAERSSSGTPTAPASATEAGNQKLAVAEAKRLLALVPVPARSPLLQPVPGDLSIPAFWGPPATSTVDLVPAGKPSRGLECFYGGSIHGPAWRLHPQLGLTAGQAQRAAATMARRPLSHPLGEAVSCPVDDGSAELIALSYPNQPDVDLWVKLSGCGGVSNGYITTSR